MLFKMPWEGLYLPIRLSYEEKLTSEYLFLACDDVFTVQGVTDSVVHITLLKCSNSNCANDVEADLGVSKQ